MEESKIDKTFWDINYVTEVLKSLIERREEGRLIMYQGCKTNGIVLRTTENLNLCQDPECVSCRRFENLLTDNLQVK